MPDTPTNPELITDLDGRRCPVCCVCRDCHALEALREALQRISDLKDEAYQLEPVSRETADVVARHAGRIAKAALALVVGRKEEL